MDLNPIGKHCALQSCNVLDFLPIQCRCLEWFCNIHVSPDLHDCSSLRESPSDSAFSVSSTSARVRSGCAFTGCNKPSLAISVTVTDPAREVETRGTAPGGCPGCRLSFCVDHRHMQSHSCTGFTTQKDDMKHEEARTILTREFLVTQAPISHTPVVTRRRMDLLPGSQKLAQLRRVNLMKLRHQAVPGDPKDRSSVIPVDQRLHVTVRLEVTNQPRREVTLWFRKTMVAGKALDLVIQHFGVLNTASNFYLKRSSPETDSLVLQNHLELSGQLEDGSTVVLTDSQSDV